MLHSVNDWTQVHRFTVVVVLFYVYGRHSRENIPHIPSKIDRRIRDNSLLTAIVAIVTFTRYRRHGEIYKIFNVEALSGRSMP